MSFKIRTLLSKYRYDKKVLLNISVNQIDVDLNLYHMLAPYMAMLTHRQLGQENTFSNNFTTILARL